MVKTLWGKIMVHSYNGMLHDYEKDEVDTDRSTAVFYMGKCPIFLNKISKLQNNVYNILAVLF